MPCWSDQQGELRGADLAEVFISYARNDADVARRFAEAFEAEGLDVWWDYILQTGEIFDEAIENALRSAKAVIVLWSPSSVASRWVRAEATIADRNKTFVPVMIEPCERPIVFELTHTADLTGWDGSTSNPAWAALLATVSRLVGERTPLQAPQVPKPHSPSNQAGGKASASKPSILILPFVNMSGDQEQEYFSDGVSEDIITDLGRVSALSVVSRNTAFSFKGKTLAAAELAKDLGVTHILEGSVRRSGDRVRITAQLFHANSDSQVWADRFDRTLDDIFAIQDEISQAIVDALKLKLAPEEKRAIAQRDTTNSEAYELYLMARQFTRSGSERMKPLIVRICKKVVELDPQFGRAWALMAMAEAEMAQRLVDGTSAEDAREWAEKAIAIAPNIAECHAALADAITRVDSYTAPEAKVCLDRALEIDPQCYDALVINGYVHLSNGEFAEAASDFEAAIAIEPTDFSAAGMAVQAYDGMGDEENKLAAARRAITRSEALLAMEPDHGGALGFIVSNLATIGESDRARGWARRALLFDPSNIRLRYNVACAMAKLGDVAACVELLESVLGKVDPSWFEWIEHDNDFDRIRDDPDFEAMMVRVRKVRAEAA